MPCYEVCIPLRIDDALTVEQIGKLQIAYSHSGIFVIYGDAKSWEFYFRNVDMAESPIRYLFYELLFKFIRIVVMQHENPAKYRRFVLSSDGYRCLTEIRGALQTCIHGWVIIANELGEYRMMTVRETTDALTRGLLRFKRVPVVIAFFRALKRRESHNKIQPA